MTSQAGPTNQDSVFSSNASSGLVPSESNTPESQVSGANNSPSSLNRRLGEPMLSSSGHGPAGNGGRGRRTGSTSLLEDEVERLRDEKAALTAYAARCEQELRLYQSAASAEVTERVIRALTANEANFPTQLTTNLDSLNPLIVAYETRLSEALSKQRSAEAQLVEMRKEVADLQRQNRIAVQEVQEVRALAARDPVRAGVASAGALSEETKELLLQLELQKQKIDILAQSELAARKELARLPEREALQRSLQDAGQVIATQKSQLLALEAALTRHRASASALTQELANEQQKGAELEIVGARFAELSHSHRMLQAANADLEARLSKAEKEIEALRTTESALKNELEGNHKDMQGMVSSLEGLETALGNAKQREIELLGLESQSLKRAEAADLQKQQLMIQLETAKSETERMRTQLQTVTAEMKAACESDVQQVYQRSKEKEAALLADLTKAEQQVLTSQIQAEQLQRQLASAQEHASKVASVCESEMVRVVAELHQAQAQVATSTAQKQAAEEKASRLRQDLLNAQKLTVTARDAAASHAREMRAELEHAQAVADSAKAKIAQLELMLSEREAHLTSSIEDLAHKLATTQEELLALQQARDVSEGDLRKRLAEAYAVHDESAEKAAEIISRQEGISAKWREQQKVALTKLQNLLVEANNRRDSDSARIASGQASIAALTLERDSLNAMLGQEEENRRALAMENIELDRRLRECQSQLSRARQMYEGLMKSHSELQILHDELCLQARKDQRKLTQLEQLSVGS